MRRHRRAEGVHVLRLVGVIAALAVSLLAAAASPSIAPISPQEEIENTTESLSESRVALATARPPVFRKVAVAFEGASPDNSTEQLDESVAPSSLAIEGLTPPVSQAEEQRALKHAEVSAMTSATESRHSSNTAENATAGPPFGGALVAVEATALLVGGATLIVLLMVKIRAQSASSQYEGRGAFTAPKAAERTAWLTCSFPLLLVSFGCTETADPMLQSLLYSDMDYAAI
ncbi:hypothetical protein BBJ28_00007244 [Nothophytophthora sp. Chile5]|nr:hypothetical protein BBJ28_00007244 [Nothophytophthora sp. Chile5]